MADYPFEKGDRGSKVRAIQRCLVKLGFMDESDDEAKKEIREKSFGEKTREAVLCFQQAHNLLHNGLVDKGTWDWLVFWCWDPGNRQLSLENPVMKGFDVKLVQRVLENRGLYSGPNNGLFNEPTVSAVMLFQQSRDLDPDGIVGEKTFKALGFEI